MQPSGGIDGVYTVWRVVVLRKILAHIPASFSSWLNDILRLSIASRRVAFSFRFLFSGTQNMRCAVSQPMPRKTRVRSSEHFRKAIK